MSTFLAEGLADQIVVTISPRFVGGLPAVVAGDGGRRRLLPRIRNVRYQPLAGDLIVWGNLKGRRARDDRRRRMRNPRLVLGLFDATGDECDCTTRDRLRDLSLSWARFGYQRPVIEGAGVGQILEDALDRGYEYCLLLGSGTLFDENWYPAHWGRRNAHASLNDLMNDGGFLAAGRTIEQASGSRAIDVRCLLVNLKRYSLCGRPQLAWARLAAIVPEPPTLEPELSPSLWSLCDGGPGANLRAFDPATAAALVDLVSPRGDAAPVAPYLRMGSRISPGTGRRVRHSRRPRSAAC